MRRWGQRVFIAMCCAGAAVIAREFVYAWLR